jgi:hypothetical protein
MNVQNIASFLDIVKKYKLLYQSCVSDFLLVKQNKQWIALCITLRLTSISKPAETRDIFSIKGKLRHIKKIEKFDINQFNETIHSLDKGSVSLSGRHVALADPHSSGPKIYDNPGWNYEGFTDAEGWPAAVLLFAGKQINDIVHDLNGLTSMIQIHQPNSYDSLPGLCKELLGFPVYPSDNSRVYVVAPFYKKLENIRLQNATLSGTFKCHKLHHPTEFRVTVIYHLISGKQSSSNFTFKSPKEETEFIEFKINENIPAKQAVLHLVHNERKIQTYSVQIESSGPSFKDILIDDHIGIDVPQVVETTDVSRDDVITLIDSFNNLSKLHLGCKVFINNAKTLAGLSRPVKSKEDFTLIIATIASIIDEVYTQDIRNQLDPKPKEPGSINLIEHLLQQKNVTYDTDSIETLRKLHRLRSNMPPIHSGEDKIISILIGLGINYPDNNSDQAARKCIKLFFQSIQSLFKNLADIESTRSSYIN